VPDQYDTNQVYLSIYCGELCRRPSESL